MAPNEKRRTGTIITGVVEAVALASAVALGLHTLMSPRKSTPRLALAFGQTPSNAPSVAAPILSTPAPAIPHVVRADFAQKPETPRSVLGRQIQAVADDLYSTNREADIERLAENLNTTSVNELTRTALDSNRSQNERFISVYVIGLRASRYAKELTEIARSQPATGDEAELAVRLQAMTALDSLAAMEPKLTSSIFQTLEREHTNPLLQKVARLGMKGAREGHPLIQKYLDMEVSEILDESN